MKRIDMLAAPGSGKSTVVAQFRATGEITWTLPGEALSLAALAASEEGVHMSWCKRLLRTLPLVKHRGLDNVVRIGEKQAFFEYANNCTEFLTNTREALALPGRSEYRRAEGYYYFIITLRRLAFLEKWMDDATVLFDESLSHKVYAVMPCDRGNENHARGYFEHMPVPAGLVHLDADADLVVKRIRERQCQTGKLIPGHRGLDDDALWHQTDASLHFARLGAQALRQRGVPVLSLDASEAPGENARKVQVFIRSTVQ